MADWRIRLSHPGSGRQEKLMLNSQNALVVVFFSAVAVAMIGWRRVVAMTLAAGIALAVVGLVQILSL
jgi:hypothetical protein